MKKMFISSVHGVFFRNINKKLQVTKIQEFILCVYLEEYIQTSRANSS